MFDLSRYLRLTDRDRNSSVLQYYSDLYSATANLAVIATAHPKIPKDRILIITSWSVLGNDQIHSGGEYVRFYVETALGFYENLETHQLLPDPIGPTPSHCDFNIVKDHYILGGDAPYAEIAYAAAGAANSIESRVRGFLIPKGTMSGF